MPELNSAALTASSPAVPTAVIVLGRDDTGKPHASRFDPSDAASATSADSLMGMHALEVANDDLDRIARELPRGRVFASGKAFVPFVRGSLYDRLVTHLPTAALVKPLRIVPQAAGGKDAPKPSAGEEGGASSKGSTAASAAHLDPEDGWAKIKLGDVVLALDATEGGWFEAKVAETKDDEFLKLTWRDYPEEAAFLRRRWNVGLLHPKQGRP